MVTPTTSESEEDETKLENEWTDEDEGAEEQETNTDVQDADDVDKDSFDDGAEIATADVHDENVTVEDGVGDINASTSSDLSDAEVDVETAEVEEEDVKSESGRFGFDGTDDADETDVDEGDDAADDEGVLGGLEDLDDGGQIAADINNGVASLGVIGIDDEKQEELREDFYQTARDFRLGYYGEECVDEYFLSDDNDGDISPVWGLVFASLVCGVIFALKRPDTDELSGKLSDAVGRIGSGIGGAS